jgi:electron transport complex protein RnfA
LLAQIFIISINAILIENYVLVQFLGICPFLGVSKRTDTALGMGMAVIFVMTLSSAITWLVNRYVLVELNLEYMQTVAFILIIAALVQFIEMVLQKNSPALYSALGIYLPLITTNCAVLGAALLNIKNDYNFLYSVIYGLMSGVGFTLAIVMFAGIREKMRFADVPKSFQGFPIALVTAGLLSIAFMGFSGMKLPL